MIDDVPKFRHSLRQPVGLDLPPKQALVMCRVEQLVKALEQDGSPPTEENMLQVAAFFYGIGMQDSRITLAEVLSDE